MLGQRSNSKRPSKEEREKRVLVGCIEHYIRERRAVGSNTLKDEGFDDLSSATIRNYFAKLEADGLLEQLHASGGRIPTESAFRWYAEEAKLELADFQPTKKMQVEKEKVSTLLQEAMEQLSSKLHGAALISSPRFDHDYIVTIKPVVIDARRLLLACVTYFGEVVTEIMNFEDRLLTQHGLLRLERYFEWRLTGGDDPPVMEEDEEQFAKELYQELMLRYIVRYANFNDEEIYRCGFSQLLQSGDFEESTLLAGALGLFENGRVMKHLLKEAMKQKWIKIWVGSDLPSLDDQPLPASLLAIPYRIGPKIVGAFAVLGPLRLPYHDWIRELIEVEHAISEKLTELVYRQKISYRMPSADEHYLPTEERLWIEDSSKTYLLEDKR